MNKKIINPKAFDEACRRAELDLNTKVSNIPAKGIIISDGFGNRYTITSDAKIVKVDGLETQVIEAYNRRIAARRKTIGNRMLKRRYKRTLQKIKPIESKGQI